MTHATKTLLTRRSVMCALGLFWCSACTTQIDVMSSGGFTAAYRTLAPDFTEMSGVTLRTAYGASMGGAPDSIPSRLERGELADVVILASDGLEQLIADGHVVTDSRVDLATSFIGMAVPRGAPIPDISTIEGFKRALVEADSIAYSASVSGAYLSTDVFPRLQLAEQLRPKSVRIVSERVGDVVARDATIGFQQVSELLPIEGVRYVGPIPAEVQKITQFSAAVTTRARNAQAAAELIAYLSSPTAASTILQTGMQPVASGSSTASEDP